METAATISPAKRLAITIAVMTGTVMTVIDQTIANVALPHMQATLGATPESIAWVLTSYLIATAIAMPITGWLETRFGRRELFTAAIIGFTLSSALCGLAWSLPMMVLARVLQGAFSAFIGPLTQAVLLDIYPENKRAKAMSIWGLGVMIGPIAGPVLGGWLTEEYNWRWVFFINVPIGIVCATALWSLLTSRPLQRVRIDGIGFLLIALALGSFQLMLDRGTQLDWFHSPEIIIEVGIALAALWMFVVHTMTARNPLIPAAVFRDGNFVIATICLLVTCGVAIGGAALIPPMLQRLLGYGTIDAGFVVAPRGLGVGISMVLAGALSSRIDSRVLIGAGLLVMAAGQWMMMGFDLQMGKSLIIWSGFVSGFGIGLVFLPLNVLAFATLPAHLRTEAASVYNLGRNIGASIAISVMTALIARNTQVSHSDLAAHITPVRVPIFDAGLIEQGGIPGEAALRLIDAEINRQAAMIAYLDDFWLMMWATLALVPLILLMRKPKLGAEAPMMTE